MQPWDKSPRRILKARLGLGGKDFQLGEPAEFNRDPPKLYFSAASGGTPSTVRWSRLAQGGKVT